MLKISSRDAHKLPMREGTSPRYHPVSHFLDRVKGVGGKRTVEAVDTNRTLLPVSSEVIGESLCDVRCILVGDGLRGLLCAQRSRNEGGEIS